jgi:hypothetical protein
MGTIITALLPVIPSLINLVEGIFSKPKSGVNKMSAVLQALRAIIEQALSAGSLPSSGTTPAQPTDDAITGMVEAILAQMKANGTLGKQTAAPTGGYFLLQGTATPLKAG